MSLPFLNNSFYGIPLGIYAMIGVTTGVLAIMTINDSSQSSASAPMFELPNILSSDEPVKEEPEPAKEEPEPVEEQPAPVEEENKLIGGKKIDGKKMIDGKKKRKTRRNKSKSDLKKPNKKTKRK